MDNQNTTGKAKQTNRFELEGGLAFGSKNFTVLSLLLAVFGISTNTLGQVSGLNSPDDTSYRGFILVFILGLGSAWKQFRARKASAVNTDEQTISGEIETPKPFFGVEGGADFGSKNYTILSLLVAGFFGVLYASNSYYAGKADVALRDWAIISLIAAIASAWKQFRDHNPSASKLYRRIRPAVNTLIICILPIAAYLSWTNGELWPAAVVLMFSWCAFIVSQVIEYGRVTRVRKSAAQHN